MWKFSLRRASRFGLVLTFCFASLVPAEAATKMKLHGYLTGRADENTLLILEDRIELTPASRVLAKDAAGEHSLNRQELSPGMLVEAEGQWLEKHRFFAEKLTVELGEDEKKIHGSAYLQEEPAEAAKIAGGETSELKVDGYWLTLDKHTKRVWSPTKAGEGLTANTPTQNGVLAGYHVKYSGLWRKDGRIEADEVDLGPPAPADDYKMPHSLEIVTAKDAQTGIDVLEFRQGKKVQGRMKLLAERTVQEYVSHLGDSLIPEGAKGTRRPIEFRFFVVEDPEVNAASLPDGTLASPPALSSETPAFSWRRLESRPRSTAISGNSKIRRTGWHCRTSSNMDTIHARLQTFRASSSIATETALQASYGPIMIPASFGAAF